MSAGDKQKHPVEWHVNLITTSIVSILDFYSKPYCTILVSFIRWSCFLLLEKTGNHLEIGASPLSCQYWPLILSSFMHWTTGAWCWFKLSCFSLIYQVLPPSTFLFEVNSRSNNAVDNITTSHYKHFAWSTNKSIEDCYCIYSACT